MFLQFSVSKDRPLKEAQRSLDLMVQVSLLSLIKNCLFGLKSRQSAVCDKRRLQTADCTLADPKPADRRPADLQTCRLDKLAHSEICRPTFFVTSTGHVSSFLRAFQKPGHPSISRQNGWRWADFYLVDYIEVVVLRWRVLRDNRILLRILTER